MVSGRDCRRRFLVAAGAGLAVGGAAGASVALGVTDEQGEEAGVPDSWDREMDVVVVGSGAAGFAAALTAAGEGAEVAMLEKAPQHGGASGGVYWIPNSSQLRDRGMNDPRADAIGYMCRCSFPTLYDPEDSASASRSWTIP